MSKDTDTSLGLPSALETIEAIREEESHKPLPSAWLPIGIILAVLTWGGIVAYACRYW